MLFVTVGIVVVLLGSFGCVKLIFSLEECLVALEIVVEVGVEVVVVVGVKVEIRRGRGVGIDSLVEASKSVVVKVRIRGGGGGVGVGIDSSLVEASNSKIVVVLRHGEKGSIGIGHVPAIIEIMRLWGVVGVVVVEISGIHIKVPPLIRPLGAVAVAPDGKINERQIGQAWFKPQLVTELPKVIVVVHGDSHTPQQREKKKKNEEWRSKIFLREEKMVGKERRERGIK